MLGFPFKIRAEHSLRSGTALFLTAAFLFLTLPQATDAQPKTAEEQGPTLDWPEKVVTEVYLTDYTKILERPEAATAEVSELGNAPPEESFPPWWALSLIGILTTLAVALAFLLYSEHREKESLRSKKESLKDALKKIDKQRKERIEILHELSSIIDNIYKKGGEENTQSKLDSLSPPESSVEHSETSLLEKIKDELRSVRSMHTLEEEFLNQVREAQKKQKGEIQSILREELAEVVDQSAGPESVKSPDKETLGTSDQDIVLQDIEELSRKIEALLAHLGDIEGLLNQVREAQKKQKGETQSILREELAEVVDQSAGPESVKSPDKETLGKSDQDLEELSRKIEALLAYLRDKEAPDEEHMSDIEGGDQQDDSPGLSVKPLLRSVDRTELLDHVKEEISASEQERQEEARAPNGQTGAGASVPEEKHPEDEEKEPEEEGPPVEVDSDFTSIRDRCRILAGKYSAIGQSGSSKKKKIVKNISELLDQKKENSRTGILNEKDAAEKVAKIFMIVWDPGNPNKSKEVLEEVTSETEGEWNFYFSPGRTADSPEEIKRREVSEIAISKINREMKEENIPDGEANTITPGIDWDGQGKGQELSYSPIQYRADYESFEQSGL